MPAPATGYKAPLRIMTIAAAITALLLLWNAWSLERSDERIKDAWRLQLAAEQLRGEILMLDAQLTDSALLIAHSGGLVGEQEYRLHEQRLQSAIERGMELVPTLRTEEWLVQMEAINKRLVTRESRVIALVRGGQVDKALAVLEGDSYRKDKQAYHEALEAMIRNMQSHTDLRLEQEYAIHQTNIVIAIGIVLGIIIGWYQLFTMLRRWSRALVENNRVLIEQSERLGREVEVRRRAEAFQKEMEDTLRANEARLRGILENVLDGIITINSQGGIESFNTAAEHIFGYSTAEVIGQNVKMLMPEPYHSQHDGYLQRYMATGEARVIGIGREVLGRRKDGSTFPLDLAVSQLESGEKARFIGIVRDITERKQALEQLHLQGAALGAAANAVMIADCTGIIRWVNPAFTTLTGYTFKEAVGRSTNLLKSGEQAQSFYKELWEVVLSGKVWHGELLNRRKDGVVYPEEQTITPVADDDGRITHFIAIKQDISERHKVDRMKREFISTVSHELRTPLTSIHGALGLLAGGTVGDLTTQASSLVSIARNNSERLVRLINDILDIEKIEAGRMSFNMQPVLLLPLLQEALEANQSYAGKFGASITLSDETKQDAEVLTDRDRLIQVVTNLLSNAAKFSPHDGVVELLLSPRPSGYRISVRDHGAGIPEKFRERIFHKFSQADSSDQRQRGGTGLGLSISKAIVERLGGEIGFNTAVGEGTTFYIDLPSLRSGHNEYAGFKGEGGSHRILICEDDPDVAQLLAMMLERNGYRTDIVGSAEQARHQLAEQHYAAMTLDLRLPGQSGIDLLRALKDGGGSVIPPIIVVSAIAAQTQGDVASDALPVVDWLTKPIDQKRLLSAVSSATAATATKPRLLHVEDDVDLAQVIGTILESVADIEHVTSVAAARECLREYDYDLVLLDLELTDGSGLSLLNELNNHEPAIPVVIFSAAEANGDVAERVAATLVKSRTSTDALVKTVRRLLHQSVDEV